MAREPRSGISHQIECRIFQYRDLWRMRLSADGRFRAEFRIRSARPWSRGACRSFCASRRPISASSGTIGSTEPLRSHGLAERLSKSLVSVRTTRGSACVHDSVAECCREYPSRVSFSLRATCLRSRECRRPVSWQSDLRDSTTPHAPELRHRRGTVLRRGRCEGEPSGHRSHAGMAPAGAGARAGGSPAALEPPRRYHRVESRAPMRCSAPPPPSVS